jgi:Zn-dependent M28 family amino/carboxypeptidase
LLSAQQPLHTPRATICEPCIRADERFLSSPELRGRGSATRDEHVTAQFAAALFASFGLEPGGENGGFLQRAPMPNPLPDRLQKYLDSRYEHAERKQTWNAVAILRGTDKTHGEAILLSAHLDHLGVGANLPDGSAGPIYPGADDDASGTTAVLELARTLSQLPRPRRTIVFVLFGSEELGGFGNHYFLDHPPLPLASIVANLEFEMIGRADPLVPQNALWLTGYERSNLGPELAKHGALLVADPHPGEHFFQRSDNYALAQRGIVAQTVSSFGLHRDYHQPTDTFESLDFAHMTSAIGAMVQPLEWLSNTVWKPQWTAGGKPQ